MHAVRHLMCLVSNAAFCSMSLETNQKMMLDSGGESVVPGRPRKLLDAGPPSMGALREDKMRNGLVTISGASLLASLLFASCVIKEKNGDGGGDAARGGSVFATGGKASTAGGGAGGATTRPPVDLAAECPDLLTKLNPGEPGVCSQSNTAAEFRQINMLLVVDKSGSMGTQPTGFAKTKWVAAGEALKGALKPDDSLISYGFLLFPYLAGSTAALTCEMANGAQAVNIGVGPAPDTVPQINQLMLDTLPSGGTPTATALAAAFDYYTRGAGASLVGSKYVLLVTDGGPNCNSSVVCDPETCTANLDHNPSSCGANPGTANCCDIKNQVTGRPNPQSLCLDDAAVVEQLRGLAAKDINTFVVGIPGSEAYASYLDTFALEGGVPVSDPAKAHKYYEVTGESGLAEAFNTITTTLVRSCVVPLEKEPLDLSNINLAIDCTPVPQMSAGVRNWHYDAAQQVIVIEGANCTRIEKSGVQRVDVVLGCPPFIAI